MTRTDIIEIFERFSSLHVGVIGDFALDVYFTLQTQTGEQSLETGQNVFWGSHAVASLGAAGNVVQNLASLGVASIYAIGCVGDDLFGREMQYLFSQLHVNTDQLHILSNDWDTCVYTKPDVRGQEGNRIDFGTANYLRDSAFSVVMTGLEQLLPELDVVIINQQFANPLLTGKRVALLNQLIRRFPTVRFLADMRDVGLHIRGATLKVNTAELAKFLTIPSPQRADQPWCVQQGAVFRRQSDGPLLLTRGSDGILYLDEQGVYQVDGLRLKGELDTVGAGDTVLASWAACLGVGASPTEALTIANLAAAVTVQKVAQTGTATLAEILHLHSIHSSDD